MEVRRGDETYFHLMTEQVRRYNLVCIYKGIYDWLRVAPACQFDWSFIFPGSGLKLGPTILPTFTRKNQVDFDHFR